MGRRLTSHFEFGLQYLSLAFELAKHCGQSA